MPSKEVFDKATLIFKTTKNPDESPYLPLDFYKSQEKKWRTKCLLRLFSNVGDLQKVS
jgi:hypothetical protein